MEYFLVAEDGSGVVEIDSFYEIILTDNTRVPSYVIEAGSYFSYNKVDNPIEIRMTVYIGGLLPERQRKLSDLIALKNSTALVSLSIPESYYEHFTVSEVVLSKRSGDISMSTLMLDITLSEIREKQTNVTTTVITKDKAKVPTDVSKRDDGKKQTDTPNEKDRSVLGQGVDIITGANNG